MVTLNLLAVSDFSARTVWLLRGAVLVTGCHLAGRAYGLTDVQFQALRWEGEPVWWVEAVMGLRVNAEERRR